ncbi:hypothetical protein DM01DRAFT_1313127 [Hesseltinella vesiculosa]|uniref:Postreplication repair E3 ubiquitin-protein ligase RAD18 n=1 Tax=Hesseltinella vesiculosa TaxID=101127 RepID=A0A1X2G2W7_9FUNG|nr:hypothetical protein DM01DRAFT_1313127 [Hesseltinella vesiculosa]
MDDTIDDPLDFNNEHLQSFDEHMRCPICKEFYNTAMILSTCSHSFCAMCIRKSLSQEQCCPKCRKTCHDSQLHNNFDLDNLVQTWKNNARKLVLDMQETEPESSAPLLPEQPASSTQRNSHYRPTSQKQPAAALLDDEDFMPMNEISTANRRSRRLVDTTAASENPELGTCPFCLQKMPLAVLNSHANRCVDGDSRIPETPPVHKTNSSLGLGKKKYLGKKPQKIAYDMYKEKDMKRLLKDLGLPDNGDRSLCVWRYREYMILYNANMDAKDPVDFTVLLKQLKQAEHFYVTSRSSSKRAMPDVSEHKEKYGDEFQMLIEKAKKRQKAKASSSAAAGGGGSDMPRSDAAAP